MELTIDEIVRLRGEGKSWAAIGGEKSRSAYRRYRRKCRDGSESHMMTSPVTAPVTAPVTSTVGVTSEVASPVVATPPQLSTDTSLLIAHGYDPKLWKVVESGCSLRSGVASTRIKVRPLEGAETFDREAFLESLAEGIEILSRPVQKHREAGERMAVFPLFDVHYGKQYVADGKTFDHFDSENAVMEATERFISRLDRTISRTYLVVGQDFMNSDTVTNTTTAGTPQDNSLPWHEMFARGFALVCEICDRILEKSPLTVIYSEGNHDRVMSFMLVKALEQRYRLNPQVKVDSRAEVRKYILWGDSIIGLSHNSEESDLSIVMQNEQSYEWGAHPYRYWLTGHLHHLDIDESNGLITIRCPSPTFADEWHKRKGYIASQRQMVGFAFGQEGMEDMWLLKA